MRMVLLGSGNVATHLAKAFKEKGWDLVQVWSRNLDHAMELADVVGSNGINQLSEVDSNADLYVIAVKDEAISDIAGKFNALNGMVVHTSGSTPMDTLSVYASHGVLYPLQTFSKKKSLDFKTVPLCIEAIDTETLHRLKNIALSLSQVVSVVDSTQRKILHLAAVFACNFTNHLYHLAQQLLEKNGLSFELLKPLICETSDKITYAAPVEVQTGPAIRGDETTITTHLGMLEGDTSLLEIYTILSRSIKKTKR